MVGQLTGDENIPLKTAHGFGRRLISMLQVGRYVGLDYLPQLVVNPASLDPFQNVISDGSIAAHWVRDDSLSGGSDQDFLQVQEGGAIEVLIGGVYSITTHGLLALNSGSPTPGTGQVIHSVVDSEAAPFAFTIAPIKRTPIVLAFASYDELYLPQLAIVSSTFFAPELTGDGASCSIIDGEFWVRLQTRTCPAFVSISES